MKLIRDKIPFLPTPRAVVRSCDGRRFKRRAGDEMWEEIPTGKPHKYCGFFVIEEAENVCFIGMI